MRWNPSQYQRFTGPRLQPGLDLLARLPEVDEARLVVDLGCGTGELTRFLGPRYPLARTIGIDNSDEMLTRARSSEGKGDADRVTFEAGDIATWVPPTPVDVLFSNAALHWVEHHETVFPRLAACVRPGGVFAAQMPANFAAPSHVLLRQVAALPAFRDRVRLPEEPVLASSRYFELLAPLARTVDIWETEYLHVLEGDEPVLDWVRGTALLPVQAALDSAALQAFVDIYGEQLAAAYPRRPDGRTLFPFRRLFMLVNR